MILSILSHIAHSESKCILFICMAANARKGLVWIRIGVQLLHFDLGSAGKCIAGYRADSGFVEVVSATIWMLEAFIGLVEFQS